MIYAAFLPFCFLTYYSVILSISEVAKHIQNRIKALLYIPLFLKNAADYIFPRIPDDDEMAAKVGVTETTIEPASFPHPTNSKIIFWDLPGIGTPNYPDLKTYCEKVMLEKYDTFLIFTAGRFTENDLKLAVKIRSVEKKFFFIRTKIDDNVRAEKRKRSFDEESMLNEIRRDCSKNLVDLVEDIREIFLISNHYPAKWDFHRLTEAIIDVLPVRQRESLILSLGIVKNLSTEILRRKIEVLNSRIWMVASASFAAAIVPLPGLSIAVDLTLITAEIAFYRSQLGLPEEGSERFRDAECPEPRKSSQVLPHDCYASGKPYSRVFCRVSYRGIYSVYSILRIGHSRLYVVWLYVLFSAAVFDRA